MQNINHITIIDNFKCVMSPCRIRYVATVYAIGLTYMIIYTVSDTFSMFGCNVGPNNENMFLKSLQQVNKKPFI